ncbi:hypothetical protein DV738_g5384, partial [Chaetothyriales sp. CBS 135597]
MSDYSKKTVADLQEILKSRKLQHTGKKAELIARLQQSDKATEAAEVAEPVEPSEPEHAQEQATEAQEPPAAASEAPTTEDPAPTADPTSATAASATVTSPTGDAAAAAASAKPSEPPTTTEPGAPSPDTTLAATTNYALNLPTESLDDEAARRKRRAERFGTGVVAANGEADSEEAKKAARAEKFGTGLGKLNEALPTERIRGAKAAKESIEDTVMDDPGLIKRGGRSRAGPKGRFRPGAGADARRRSGRTPDRPTGVRKAAAYTSDKDRAAAEARKKRFAQAS